MKNKVYIFGAGVTGTFILPAVQDAYEVIGFLDNDEHRWGTTTESFAVESPEVLNNAAFDGVVIAALTGMNAITQQLLEMGIPRDKIIREFIETTVKSRIVFLEKLAELWSENPRSGSIAEGGVFQGEFAKEINRLFPEKTLYLFDTFSGFDVRDVAIETQSNFSVFGAGHSHITSEELVLQKMPHPDNIIIRKGFFPETTAGIDDSFCLVNLDFDLYQPTLAGLEFFYPRMVCGGIIMIHDYFSQGYKGVKQAVKEFEKKEGALNLFPIGDGLSLGIYCQRFVG